jgi:hypothetical protein
VAESLHAKIRRADRHAVLVLGVGTVYKYIGGEAMPAQQLYMVVITIATIATEITPLAQPWRIFDVLVHRRRYHDHIAMT